MSIFFLQFHTATDSDNNPNTFDAQWLWNSGGTDTGKLTFLDTDPLKSGPEEWSATFTSTQTSLLLADANHDSWPDGFIAKDSQQNDIQVPLTWQAKDSANVVARFSVSANDEQNHPAIFSGVLKDTNNDTLPDQIIGSWGAMSFDFGINLIDTNSDGKFDQVSIIQTSIRSGLVQVDATSHPAGFYLANSTSGDFTAPIVSTFSPIDEATGVTAGSNIVLTFREIIGRGTGTIAIHSGSATGSVVESYDATTSTNLSISSHTLTINPTAVLVSGTHYFVTLDPGSIKNIAGNSYAGTSSYDFTTAAAADLGTSGNDTFYADTAPRTTDGGAGVDTVIFSGKEANYSIVLSESGFSVKENLGTDGIDTVLNIEKLQFTDHTLTITATPSETLLESYRIYKAAFDRAPDYGGLGFWYNAMDHGASLSEVAGGFIGSNEFKTMYGTNPSDSTFVTLLYQHVLGRTYDQGGYNYWLNILNAHLDTKANVLAHFSESAENIANVTGVITNGIIYEVYAA